MTSGTKSEPEKPLEISESLGAQNASKDQIDPNETPTEQVVRMIIKVSPTEQFEYQTGENEVGGELYQLLKDRESTCHRTCYTIRHNGNVVDVYSALTTIPDINGSVLTVQDEPYTLRDVRHHVRHLVELTNPNTLDDTFSRASNKDCVGLSFYATLDLHKDDGTKSMKELDTSPPDYALPGQKDRNLAHLLPKIEKLPKAFKNISLSPFNPPPGPRKLRGDVLYLDIDLNEKKRISVTACSQGFYVNASTEEHFNPNQSNQHKVIYQTLVDLLNAISPSFKKAYPIILENKKSICPIENYNQHHPIAWFAPQKKESELYFEDSQRAEDVANIARLGIEGLVPDQMPGSMRDWNDELRFLGDMDKSTFQSSIMQERCYGRAYSDFVNAAVKGAVHVAEGNIAPLNPADEKKVQMFIFHNIFYGLGCDVKDHYKDFGGDAAAFALMPIDLQGIRAYQGTTKNQIYTVGMVVVDYLGQRITAQSIIPGILEKEQELTVLNGSLDHGKTIVTDSRFDKLKENSEELRILPHDVIVGEGDEQKTVTLYTSYDTKGVIGDDQRMFILDLYRTNPPDANFIVDTTLSPKLQALGFPRVPPHKFFTYRRELLESYIELATARYFRAFSIFYKEEKDKENGGKMDDSKDENEKRRAVIMNVLQQKCDEITEPAAKIAMKKAAAIVNSVDAEKFDIKYNPDCFSKTVKHAPTEDLEKQQALIKSMGEFLLLEQLPGLAEHLLRCEYVVITGESLTQFLHSKGINVRYLGEFLKLIQHQTKSYLTALTAMELLARSIKHVFRSFFSELTLTTIGPAVVHLLNCLFGETSESPAKKSNGNAKSTKKKRQPSGGYKSLTPESLWKLISDDAATYYGYNFKQNSFKAVVEAFNFERTALLARICRSQGIQLVAKDYHLENSARSNIFTLDDIHDMFPVFKHQNPISQEAKKLVDEGHANIATVQFGNAYSNMAEAVNTMNFVYYQQHPELVNAYSTLSRLCSFLEQDLGESNLITQFEALTFQTKATLISERTSGLDSNSTINEYVNLGHVAFQTGKQSSALKLFYRARYVLSIVFGERHPLMAQIDACIGLVNFFNQEYELAQRYFQSSRNISNEIGEPKGWKHAVVHNLLARTLAYRGDFRSALTIEKETNQIYTNHFGPTDIRTVESDKYLIALTKQAVTMQMKLHNDGKSSIKDLYQIESPSFNKVRELMKIINGYFVRAHDEELAQLERAEENGKEEKKEVFDNLD